MGEFGEGTKSGSVTKDKLANHLPIHSLFYERTSDGVTKIREGKNKKGVPVN
jgi:hypothetical protein